jgi:hypothetical protein
MGRPEDVAGLGLADARAGHLEVAVVVGLAVVVGDVSHAHDETGVGGADQLHDRRLTGVDRRRIGVARVCATAVGRLAEVTDDVEGERRGGRDARRVQRGERLVGARRRQQVGGAIRAEHRVAVAGAGREARDRE